MFSGFTEEAKELVTVVAQRAAARLGDTSRLYPQHVVLAIAEFPESEAHQVLGDTVDLSQLGRLMSHELPRHAVACRGDRPFDPQTKEVLENATEIALSRRRNCVGTGDILLALHKSVPTFADFIDNSSLAGTLERAVDRIRRPEECPEGGGGEGGRP